MNALYILANLILSSVVVFVTASLLPGVFIRGFGTAVVVAVILGLLNSLIRPILFILTLPVNILTLGLFTFVIMGFMVWLTSQIVPGFEIQNFWWCILFAIILAVLNGIIQMAVM